MFEIWYAVQAGGKYVQFNKNRELLEETEIFYEDFERIAELAVSLVLQHTVGSVYVFTESQGNVAGISDNHSEYIALVENAAISSIMDYALANHLYEDQSNLHHVIITPIIRCERCQIMYVDSVFYWSYISEEKGMQSATPESVLAKVCLPTAAYGDRRNIPCLAKSMYEVELNLKNKSPSELQEFVNANSSKIEMELSSDEEYLKMAKEVLMNMNEPYKFVIGQLVSFGNYPYNWRVFSRYHPEKEEQPQYYVESQTTPAYHQVVLESDLREVKNA